LRVCELALLFCHDDKRNGRNLYSSQGIVYVVGLFSRAI